MNRRHFLKALLVLGMVQSSLRKSGAAAAERPSEEPQIIVVGAGIAGLAAASELAASGYRILVLEARDRLGGRIWTNRSLGSPVDMGASWIHGVTGNPMKALAVQLGIETSATDYDDVIAFDAGGHQLSNAELGELANAFEELVEEVESFGESRDANLSIGAAFDHVRGQYSLTPDETVALNYASMSAVVAAAAELNELSLMHADQDDGFEGRDELFPAGYDQIARYLARTIDIRFNTVVSAIEHSASGVRIATSQGTYDAEYAIVTLPLGVLKRGSVSFRPPLPAAKQDAIGKLGVGVLNKVALRFPEVFWPRDREFIGYMSRLAGEYPQFLNWQKHSGSPVLLAFTGGDFARRLEDKTEKEIESEIMRILQRIFGHAIPEPDGLAVSRWRSDAYAAGSYSHIPPGATGAEYDRLADPVDHGRLLFAGEATIRQYPATVHGAYLSGIREAKRINP